MKQKCKCARNQETDMSEKFKKFTINGLITIMVLILVTILYYYVQGRLKTSFPEVTPQDGVLDVRDISFEDTVYSLNNNWDYYPGKLYWSEDFQDEENMPRKAGPGEKDMHVGSYRLIILAQPNQYLEIGSYSIDYSMRIIVNGVEERNIGYVSDDPAEAKAHGRYVTYPFFTGEDGRVEIIYQYSNFIHNEGGFIQATVISTPKNIDEYKRGIALNAMFVSCGLLFLSFYFLLCALYQESREHYALAFSCFVIAFRNQYFTFEHLLSPDRDFMLWYRVFILIVTLLPAVALYLLAAFYPKVMRRGIVLTFTALFTVLTAMHFIVDSRDLVKLCRYSYYVCVPFLIIFLVKLIHYFSKEVKINMIEIITLFAIMFYIVVVIREGLTTGSNSRVAHYGITPYASFVCSMLLSITISIKLQHQRMQLAEEKHKNEVLEQVNAVNKEFLRTVAHELRTPLTVISGYAQLMERQIDKNVPLEQPKEKLSTISSEADRLGNIVTKLMDYTYGSKNATEFGGVDVNELLRGAQAVLVPVCHKRNNQLEVENHCSFMIHANYELLLQVLINLIVNASRHTENGTIKILVSEGDGFAEFFVSDTGTGINAEDAPHIFEKGFTTGSGKGLGLAICKETIQMHGGTIDLASSGSNGTVFRFTIPKEK